MASRSPVEKQLRHSTPMALMASTQTYTTPGITSNESRNRQSGPLQLVTTDANGNLAADNGDTFRAIAKLQAGVALATNTACGQNAQATGGQFSSAYGANSEASGFESTALGGAATATAQWGTSVGVLANSGFAGTAVGVGANATGNGAALSPRTLLLLRCPHHPHRSPKA